MDISIVIPAYNEEQRIGVTLEQTTRYLSKRPWRWEIIVVDDGSSDATAATVATWGRRGGEIYLLRNGQNRGKGYSVRSGVARTRGRIVGFLDADYKTDIAALDSVVEMWQEGIHGIIGDRSLPESVIRVQRRRHRQWGSLAFRRILHTAMGLRQFGDTQCGFKFFRAEVARDLFAGQCTDGFMFDVEILLKAVAAGYVVQSIPVMWSDDANSSFRPITGSVFNLVELLRIRWLQR